MCDSLLPDAKEGGLLSGGRRLRLPLEGAHMVDAEHCGRHEPGNPEGGADHDKQRHDQEVQVVAAALEQLVLLPVDDDRGDLLIHEQEDGQEQGGDGGEDVDIPGGGVIKQRNEPAPGI